MLSRVSVSDTWLAIWAGGARLLQYVGADSRALRVLLRRVAATGAAPKPHRLGLYIMVTSAGRER